MAKHKTEDELFEEYYNQLLIENNMKWYDIEPNRRPIIRNKIRKSFHFSLFVFKIRCNELKQSIKRILS